ncbi:MAG: cob(I)yrinic acid a,c-diamide adenosyltransferase [Tissierellia bacterium]|nr:cob(I)yrinic acid a,c-diamide adenosyltransferase [Tissierellia bacterium]
MGFLHVYTGDGKGKTTAALGLALRAVCAGKRVFMGQFLKGMAYSELKAPDLLPGFTIEQFGDSCFVGREPSPEEIAMAQRGLQRMREVLQGGDYDVVIFDEVHMALFFRLIGLEELLEVLALRGEGVEVITTGRSAPRELMDAADLVTEMVEVKHYYQQGVLSRRGIDN